MSEETRDYYRRREAEERAAAEAAVNAAAVSAHQVMAQRYSEMAERAAPRRRTA